MTDSKNKRMCELICKYVSEGVTLTEALRLTDWQSVHFYSALREFPECRQSYEDAKEDAREKAVDRLYEQAEAYLAATIKGEKRLRKMQKRYRHVYDEETATTSKVLVETIETFSEVAPDAKIMQELVFSKLGMKANDEATDNAPPLQIPNITIKRRESDATNDKT